MSVFPSSSGVHELMLCPILDEGQGDLHWIAAGIAHSWLDMTRTAGLWTMNAFQARENTAGSWTTQNINSTEFVSVTTLEMSTREGQDSESKFHQFGLHLALLAARDASERGDFVRVSTALELVTAHIPWLGSLRSMSTQLQEGDADKGLQAFTAAMDFTNTWMLLDSEYLDHHGAIQPWIRTSLLAQLISASNTSKKAALYALDGPGDGGDGQDATTRPKVYIWTCPTEDLPGETNYSKTLLLDDCMRPVLLISGRQELSTFAGTGNRDWSWEVPERAHGLYTLKEWKTAVTHYPGNASQMFRDAAASIPHKLAGLDLAAALQLWVDKSNNTMDWESTTEKHEIIYWASRMAQAWGQENPQLDGLVQTFTDPWEYNGQLAQVDAWRHTAQSMTADIAHKAEHLPLPPML